MSVSQANPTPGAPKKTDDKSFFDVSIMFSNQIHLSVILNIFIFQLRTNRRTYNFSASDMATAQEWIEKVQACLQ